MLTRSIRILCLTLLAAGLLAPPAWVVCLEPTGEVRVELAACCDATRGGAPGPAVQQEDTGCGGCSDVALFSPGLRAMRADCHGPVLLTAAIAPSSVSPERVAVLRVTCERAQRGPAPFLEHLASTVITS